MSVIPRTEFSRVFGFLSTLALLCCFVANNALASQPQKVREVEGISEYRLKNGLTVLLFPDQSKETVTVNITYHVGSKHENYGETGMAHLLEHLLFKGSKNHEDIPDELSAHGAKPNGTTWVDRTNYYETFSATEENIDWALSLESDRMINSFVRKEDLDSEMTVVRNEFERGENNPFRVSLQAMMAAAYMWHNYGKSTIGARSDIENVDIERLRRFYRTYYQPDNATLVITGKFDEKEILRKIKKTFGKIKKPKRSLPRIYTDEPDQGGEKKVVVRRVGDVKLMLSSYHIPPGAHEDIAAINLLAEILGNTPRGRLHKHVVNAGLATSTFGFTFEFKDPGLAIFGAQTDVKQDITETAKALHKQVEGAVDKPITQDELERAKRTLLKNIELSFNSSEGIALQLSEWIGMGDWRLIFLNRDRIEAATLEHVQKVAEKYLQRNNRTSVYFYPEEKPARVEIPDAPDIEELLKGYKGRKAVSQGEVFDPSFDNIDKRTETINMADGFKLRLLKKKTRGDAIALAFIMRFGDEKSLWDKGDIADAVAANLMRGAEGYSREALQDEFDKLKSKFSLSGGSNYVYGNLETDSGNLQAAVKLALHVLKKPSFEQSEFELYKNELKVSLEYRQQDPQALAFLNLKQKHSHFKPGHPQYVPDIAEALNIVQSLDHKDLAPFHKEYYGKGNIHFSVVGDVEANTMTSLIKDNLGKWKKGAQYERIPETYKPLKASLDKIITPDKENSVFIATMALPLSDTHPDAPALRLANYMFGGGFINSRLATRLRENDGLSYSVSSWVSLDALDEKGQFSAYAICAPQNIEKVQQGFKEELQKVLDKGFTDDEIAKAKKGMFQRDRVSRTEEKKLVGKFINHLFLGRNMQWEKRFELAIDNLDADDIQKAMKRHIRLEDFSYIRAGDFEPK